MHWKWEREKGKVVSNAAAKGKAKVKTIGREKRQKLRNDILLAKCKPPTGPILIKPITEFYAHAYLTSNKYI